MARRSLTGDALEQRRQHLELQLTLWRQRVVEVERAALRARAEADAKVQGAREEVARLEQELARLEGESG